MDNIASLCGSGTTGCHGLVEERDPEACGKLRLNLRTEQIVYVLAKKGKDFLDRYYPLPGASV